MINKFFDKIKVYKKIEFIFICFLIITSIFCAVYTYVFIVVKQPDPNFAVGIILIDLVVLLLLIVVIARGFISSFLKKSLNKSTLYTKFITMFSIAAAIPAITVALFSTYFLHFGLRIWFDQKVSASINQSINIANAYIKENNLGLAQTAISIVDDIDKMYYKLLNNNKLLEEVLNGQAEFRSLDEGIIFQTTTKTILAKTRLTFSLAFAQISPELLKKADKGLIVEVNPGPDLEKIRVLVKLRNYSNTYLLIGKLLDTQIIDYVNQTYDAAKAYENLRKNISKIQIKFSIIFIIIAFLLILAAISVGILFASKITIPIQKLVEATIKVKKGNLLVHVEENQTNDEINVLIIAFNEMIQQLNQQQRDLVIAQKTAAWAEVARRIAHEIKNPLTPIQLATQRLLNKYKDQVEDPIIFTKYIDTILRNTKDITQIVAEFISFASLPKPYFVKCEFISFLKKLVESRQMISESIKYDFKTNIEYIYMVCDNGQLNQVMTNLFKNAEESLSNVDRAGIIEVIVKQVDQKIFVLINDNGEGVKKDLLNNITEPYITTKGKGSGLGLAIVKKIIQDHYGEITVENITPYGASVILKFDLAQLNAKLLV